MSVQDFVHRAVTEIISIDPRNINEKNNVIKEIVRQGLADGHKRFLIVSSSRWVRLATTVLSLIEPAAETRRNETHVAWGDGFSVELFTSRETQVRGIGATYIILDNTSHIETKFFFEVVAPFFILNTTSATALMPGEIKDSNWTFRKRAGSQHGQTKCCACVAA